MSKISLLIDNTECIGEHFSGANAVYHAYAYRSDNAGRAYTPSECEIEMERVSGMQLKVARTYFDCIAYENGEWNWNSDTMQEIYRWIGEMQKRDVWVGLNACWWMCDNVFLNENSPLRADTPEKSADNYGAWVSELVHQIIELRGFDNVKFLYIFTEPEASARRLQEAFGFEDRYESYGLCVRAAHRHLIADGRRHLVKLIGPNDGIMAGEHPYMLEWCGKNLAEELDIFTTHSYLDIDLITKPDWQAYCGKHCLGFEIPGFRAQQKVCLEPDTEYEVSVYARALGFGEEEKSGRGFFLGAFKFLSETDGKECLIRAGGDGDSSLNKGSVVHFTADEITDEWQKYTVRFNSGTDTECLIGVFHDIPEKNVVGYYDCMSLKKVGNNRELLLNADFEDIESRAWRVFRTGYGGQDNCLREYYFWKKEAENYMSFVPKGKEFCFDEYNTRPIADFNRFDECLLENNYNSVRGISLAVAQTAFMNAGVNSSLLWALFDQQWPNLHWDGYDSFVDGDHRCGIMPRLNRTKVPYPTYYCFTLLSRYLGDRDSRLFKGAADGGICTAMVEASNGHITVLAVNCSSEERAVSLEFTEAINRSFNRHLYDSQNVSMDENAELIGIDRSFSVSKELCDILPPLSAAVYTTRED